MFSTITLFYSPICKSKIQVTPTTKRWVATGDNPNSLAYSSNGTTWTGLGKTIFSTICYSIAWNGLRWVAGGETTNALAYSTNGTTWTGLGLSIFSNVGYAVASNTYKILPLTLAL